MNTEVPDPPDNASGSANQRESGRDLRRSNILSLAQQLFSQKGYEATTMAEIAQAANLAVGTLYKIFKDKHDLYQTLVADTVQDFERRLAVVMTESTGDELAQIHKYIDVGAQLFVEHLPFIRVYFSETGAAFLFTTAGLEDDAFQSYWRIVAALRETFRRGVEKGLFVDIDPAVLALGLEGVHNAFLGALVRDPDSFTPEQIAEYTKRLFFESVLRR